MSHQIGGGEGSNICDGVWPGGGKFKIVTYNFSNEFFSPAFINIYHLIKSFIVMTIWHVNFFVCLKFSIPILLWKILYINMKLRIFEYKRYWWIFMYRRYLIFCTLKLRENVTKNKNFNFISIFFGFLGGEGVEWVVTSQGGGAKNFVTPCDPEEGGGQK